LPYKILACRQRYQSLVAGVGDSDNSLSMSWGKSGTRSSMNHAAGAVTGWHGVEACLVQLAQLG
jgi:hypothetical protein